MLLAEQRALRQRLVLGTIGMGAMALGGWMVIAAGSAAAAGLAVGAAAAEGTAATATASGVTAASVALWGTGTSTVVASSAAVAAASSVAGGAAVGGAAAGAGTAASLALFGALAAGGAAAGGVAQHFAAAQAAQAVPCLGARVATALLPTLEVQQVLDSEADGPAYQDVIFWPEPQEGAADGAPPWRILYVGDFRGRLPHGRGRLFWEATQMEALIGEFEDGRIKSGVFLSERQIVLGNMRVTECGGLKVSGFQPETLYRPEDLCAICFEMPTLLAEGVVMAPCFHGMVCRGCMELSVSCPICQTPVECLKRIC